VLSTHTFRFLTGAPAEQVWGALTCPELTRRYLHGLSARSTWQPGAALELSGPAPIGLAGEVLLAQPPRALCYSIDHGGYLGSTYISWLLRPAADGCVVRLDVDEPDSGAAASVEELEDVWLPVLGGLQSVLAGERRVI